MMPDREKYIDILRKAVKAVKEFNEDAPIKISLECVEDILELLKEKEDLGTELTNAVELIHKKNERIEKLLKEQDEEHRRLLSWLGKFCRHIDNGDAWLTDEENIAFFKEKMKQQFGWDTD